MKTGKTKCRFIAALGAVVTLLYAMAGVHTLGADSLIVENTDDNGPGTLREALATAPEGFIIDLTGLSGAILLTSGELVVDKSLTILGPGSAELTVDAQRLSRVFHITPDHTVTIDGLTIANGFGSSVGGGGIFNDHSSLTVRNCELSGNLSDVGGGAIHTYASSGNATLTVANSTLSGNWAFSGGAIHNEAQSSGSATLTVANSTLSGNLASISGGGIVNEDRSSGSATLTVANSTLSGNSCAFGGGIFNVGMLEIGNTILNAGSDGWNIENAGTVISRGFNLSSDEAGGDASTGPGGLLNAAGDQRNTAPLLGPLLDNGGPTFTHALSPGSPAIDKGNRNAVPALGTNTDQRGLPRPVDDPAIPNALGGDGSDIGAIEMSVDLLVSLGVDKASVKQGELLTYTLTVRNFGLDVAENVVLDDVISSGTTFASARANKGHFTAPPVGQSGVITWYLGTLAGDDQQDAKIEVKVIVKGKTTITNTASVSGAIPDPNPANNTASITTTVVAGASGKKK